MENRRYEQGGVVSFLVIALALSALLIGGIFLMKNQARSARETNQVAVNEPQSEEQSEAPAEEEDKTSATEGQPTEGQDPTPAPTNNQNPTPATPSQPATPAPTSTSAPTTGTTNRVATTGPSYGEEATGTLPSTGLEDAIAPLFAIGGLGTGLYLYAESQRKMRTSALK